MTRKKKGSRPVETVRPPVSDEPRRGPTRRILLGMAAAIVVAIAVAYAPVAGFGFVNFDDTDYVTANPHVKAGVTWSGVQWAFTSVHASNWHPITWISHMVDVDLYGLRPGGHHVTSVVLHAANALLLLLFLARATGAPLPSAVVAALFALHPLHVESVAWVAERKDVLAAFFWLATFLAYARYVEKPGVARYAVVALGLALGLMSKPMVVTLPFTLLLLDYWPLRRAERWPRLVLEKLPLLALSAASSVVTFFVQARTGAVMSEERFATALRVENAITAYARYLGRTFWPSRLAFFYPYPRAIPAAAVGASLALLAAMTWACLAVRRTRPYLIFGWLFFLGTLVPAIGLVQVGTQSMADRYTYVPLIGVFVMLTWGIADAAASHAHARALAGVPAALGLTACLLVTAQQVMTWKNNHALYEHALAVTRDNLVAEHNLASALMKEGRHAEALTHYREALRINPGDGHVHYNLAVALEQEGAEAEAEAHYREAVRLLPAYASAHNNLGVIAIRAGRHAEAIGEFRQALAAGGDDATAADNLAFALAKHGDPGEAERLLAMIAPRHAGDPLLPYHRGLVLAREGRMPAGLTELETAAQLNAHWPDPKAQMAWILVSAPAVRDPGRALAAARDACERSQFKNPMALQALAAAHAASGRFEEAMATLRQAEALATPGGERRKQILADEDAYGARRAPSAPPDRAIL